MSIHKTKDGKWEVRWREGSRNRGRRFSVKEDATKFDRHVQRQSQLGEAVPTRTGSETLDEFFADWLVSRHSLAPRTLSLYQELYETHVAAHLGYAPLTACTPERLEEWQSRRLAEGAGVEVLRKTQTMLHGVFKKAVRLRRMSFNPVEGMEKPRREKREIVPATPLQIEQMRGWLTDQGRIGDAVLISVMGYGGLRVGEALALRWDDFRKGNLLWISHSLEDDGSLKPTKTNKDRLIQLPEPCAEDLLTWRRETGAQGLIFPRARDGKGWTKTDRNNWRRRWFDKAKEAAGWGEPLSKLRHSCASLRILSGETSMDVAEYMGHSLRVSVDTYQRPLREMRGQERRSVDEMIREARTICEQELAKDEQGPLSNEAGRIKDLAL